jgi:hypothetical protein
MANPKNILISKVKAFSFIAMCSLRLTTCDLRLAKIICIEKQVKVFIAKTINAISYNCNLLCSYFLFIFTKRIEQNLVLFRRAES